MKFFIDTAKVEDIKKANDMGIICGRLTGRRRIILPWQEAMLWATG